MVSSITKMIHRYPSCPYKPADFPAWRVITQTDCPWCLQREVFWYEKVYRDNPEGAINYILSGFE